MADDRPPEILGSLPRSRPHRRSEKRPAAPPADQRPRSAAKRAAPRPAGKRPPPGKRPGADKRPAVKARPRTEPLRQPKQPDGGPPVRGSRKPLPPSGTEILSTAGHAAVELMQIGLAAGGRTVRNALRRLPRL